MHTTNLIDGLTPVISVQALSVSASHSVDIHMKHKHITDSIEQSDHYNERLADGTSNASPAGKLDAAIPLDPQTNVVISEKDGVNYVTGCDTGTPRAVLDVIDSNAGHEATNHAVYTEQDQDARRVFAALLESQCLIETVVNIYYKEDSKFVYFEPADQSKSNVELFIDRHSVSATDLEDPDSNTASDDNPELSSEIETDTLQSYLKCWIANTSSESPPSAVALDRMLSGVGGLNKVARVDDSGGRQGYWQFDGRVWDFD
jgi:hypothetical protein